MATCISNIKGGKELIDIMGGNKILAYEAVYRNGGEIPPPNSPIIEQIKKFKLNTGPEVQEEIDKDGESTGYYITDLKKKFKRTTDYHIGFLKEFSIFNRKLKEGEKRLPFNEYLAEKRFHGLADDETLINPYTGEKETKDQYAQSTKKMSEHGRVKGSVIHKAIEAILNPERATELQTEIDQMLADFELEYGDSDKIKWEWIRNKDKKGNYVNVVKMLEAMDINALSEIDNASENEMLRDQIFSEVKIVNEDLGYGGTIDMLVKKPSGKYTIVDWKTGKNFNPTNNELSNAIMKYGNQQTKDIFENPLNKAKLQIMFYALMMKANNPNIKFDKLAISWIPSAYDAGKRTPEQNIDVKAYLSMMEQFFSDKEALKAAGIQLDIKEKLLAKDANIFNPKHYAEALSEDMYAEMAKGETTPQRKITEYVLELNALVGKGYASATTSEKRTSLAKLSSDEREKVIQLTRDILSLQAEGAVDMFGEMGESINSFVTYLGNFNDINNPLVQEWKRYYDKQQAKIRRKMIEKENKFHSLLQPLIEKEKKNAIGIRGMRNFNYDRLYGKFFVTTKSEHTGYATERLIHKDETDPELKNLYNNLSTNEKLFIDYVNEEFANLFSKDAYVNKRSYETEGGRSLTGLEAYNEKKSPEDKFNYEKGFFFKLPITNIEIKNKYGMWDSIKKYIQMNLTYFIEDQLEDESANQQFVPIKYLGNKYVNNSQLYTKNIEFIFTGGIKSMLEKEHLDSVYSLGAGISSLLAKDEFEDKYKNLKDFVDMRLFGQIQGRKARALISRRGFKITKMSGKDKGTHKTIAIEKIPKIFQNWASMGIMWWKPVQALGNTVHGSMLIDKDVIKNKALMNIDGYDKGQIDYTPATLTKARYEYKNLMKDTVMGDIRKNKMLLLARKFDFLGNNYDYSTMDKFKMSENFKYFDKSTGYLFHSIGEEFISLTGMTAQLMHMKNDKTGKSIWDSYKVIETGPGIYDLEWIGDTRGVIKKGSGLATYYEEVDELTAQEQAKLRRVHEKLQGGYRSSESTNAEIYPLFSIFLQFRKYLPRLILNMFHSKMNSTDLGYYKKLHDKDGKPIMKDINGKELPVFEWQARVEEGRFRSLTHAFVKIIGARPEKLSDIEKENMIEAVIAATYFTVAMLVGALLFADADDDDAAKKWWRMYAIDNLSQQYNLLELAKTSVSMTTPVAISQLNKTVQASMQLLMAGAGYAVGNNDLTYTQKGDVRGWNVMKKTLPFITTYYDLTEKAESIDTSTWGGLIDDMYSTRLAK